MEEEALLHVPLSLPDDGGAVQCITEERIAGNVGLAGLRELSIVRRYKYRGARLNKVDLEV
jgi:hypothetical protein